MVESQHIRALLLLALASVSIAAGPKPDAHFPIPTCESGTVTPSVEQLVKPVLLARAAWIRSGKYLDKSFEPPFYKLLATKGATALEAKVALMAYYTGEHYGEELLDAVLGEHALADRLVQRYRECRPRVSFEDRLEGVLVLRTQYDIYAEIRAQSK
jgi:hypothetical protein